MSKVVNLSVFIDGTGNSNFKKPPEDKTNVGRLKEACAGLADGDIEQRVYYKPGVGTRRWEGWFGNIAGVWLKERVDEAKTWLSNELKIAREDGNTPKIYIFGFSRGAYAARWLANELHEDIEFLGVWDTVKTTLKGPDVNKAKSNIKKACHAMAIDEHRVLFGLTRFKDSPQATEVWFPGSHSDVGGGYKDRRLSVSALNWIARNAERNGLLIDWAKIPAESTFDRLPVIHDEASKKWWRILDWFSGDSYCNREIVASDTVYPSVIDLRAFNYSPDFLPAGCNVLNEANPLKAADIAGLA